MERQWTNLTGEEGQPNRIVCRDGFEVFNIIRGAFRGDHYVRVFVTWKQNWSSHHPETLGQDMPGVRPTMQTENEPGK